MATGDLRIQITTLKGNPIGGPVVLDFDRFSGDRGAGGSPMRVTINADTASNFRITGLLCRGGPGTMNADLMNRSLDPGYEFGF